MDGVVLPDIPVDGGPYKFRGLPGLILKVEDSEKHFSWTMTGIERKARGPSTRSSTSSRNAAPRKPRRS